MNPWMMRQDSFKKDDKVLYIPNHAGGDKDHPHCEEGIVSSVNESYVFVRYRRHGVLQITAEATRPENLVKI